MTIKQKTFAANSVLKADDVNNYLRDITVVDLISELASLDAGITTAFCLENRRLWSRGDLGWERYSPIGTTNSIIGTSPVPASAKIRMHAASIVTSVSNTAGGVNISYGTTYTNGVISVLLAPGDTSGGLALILPIANQYTLSQAGCIAYQSGSQGPVANGNAIRVNVISVGW